MNESWPHWFRHIRALEIGCDGNLCLIVQNLKNIIYSIHMLHYEIKNNINNMFSWEILEKAIPYTDYDWNAQYK